MRCGSRNDRDPLPPETLVEFQTKIFVEQQRKAEGAKQAFNRSSLFEIDRSVGLAAGDLLRASLRLVNLEECEGVGQDKEG